MKDAKSVSTQALPMQHEKTYTDMVNVIVGETPYISFPCLHLHNKQYI